MKAKSKRLESILWMYFYRLDTIQTYRSPILPDLMPLVSLQQWATVLVHGASGSVGIAAIQLAKAAGFTVIGTASSERGRSQVIQEGADYAVNHADPNYAEQILDLTQGQGPDLILSMKVGFTFPKDLQLAKNKGRIVMIGVK
jgi:NADPH:quinone reductase-like Zn-dependent oxidoreductase